MNKILHSLLRKTKITSSRWKSCQSTSCKPHESWIKQIAESAGLKNRSAMLFYGITST